MSKEQRWLVKNSLISEAVVNNSFLITQAKKLIGSGTLNKDYTSNTLWLPTKSSNLSTLESSIYFNNLSQNLFSNNGTKTPFLKLNNLTQSNFNNLNFFENSRLWTLKKYFFNNQQSLNIIISSPKVSQNHTTLLNMDQPQINNTFNSYLYYNNLVKLLNNTFTPSLSNPNNLINNTTYSVYNSPKSTINLKSTTLDLLSGTNTNFIFLLTSNPQNNPNQLSYFNNLDFSNSSDNNYYPHNNIKFQ
jgi:hypothetical protein